MKAVVIRHPGRGIDAWKLVEREVPTAGVGQIQIRMRAASLNYRDLMVAKDQYGKRTKDDLVALADGAGEISAVGPGVTRWKVGDRVATAYYPTWLDDPLRDADRIVSGGSHGTDGVLAEYVVWPEAGAVRIPEYLSFEEAATLPCAGVTAWSLLFEPRPRFGPGADIVVQGTGGVSIFVAQLALAAGHRVIATSSSDAKIARLRALGVRETINYRANPEWQSEVLARTDGRGADQVVDVGGAGTLSRSFAATRPGGTVSVIGLLTGFAETVDPLPILFRNLEVQGISVGSVAHFEALNRALGHLQLRPVIDQILSLDQARAALAKLEEGAHFGKLVIRI